MEFPTEQEYAEAERLCETLPPYQRPMTVTAWRATFTREQRAAYDLLRNAALASGTF